MNHSRKWLIEHVQNFEHLERMCAGGSCESDIASNILAERIAAAEEEHGLVEHAAPVYVDPEAARERNRAMLPASAFEPRPPHKPPTKAQLAAFQCRLARDDAFHEECDRRETLTLAERDAEDKALPWWWRVDAIMDEVWERTALRLGHYDTPRSTPPLPFIVMSPETKASYGAILRDLVEDRMKFTATDVDKANAIVLDFRWHEEFYQPSTAPWEQREYMKRLIALEWAIRVLGGASVH